MLGIGSPNYVVAKSLRVNALKNKVLQITSRRQRDQNEQNDISQLNLTESLNTLRQQMLLIGILISHESTSKSR